MSMRTPRCIDWGVLGDCGEAERGRAILGEDTPWTRLFDLAELPSYRLITVEFLSTFRYRAHQAAVRVDEDAKLPPDIEFSLCGQHFEMSIERFAVYLGIYYELETVTDGFAHGLTQGKEGVMRAWWAQISDTPFTGHWVRATMIRDPMIRYNPLCIVTTISGRGQSQEWVTMTDLFYLHSLLAGRPCNLARCFALYYASFYHLQERGTLWGGAFITHIARTRGVVDMLDDLQEIEPRKLDRRTIISMKLAADIPGVGLRFIEQDSRPFQPPQAIVLPDQQHQQEEQPRPSPLREQAVESPPRGEEEPPQHPPHAYRAVRLTEPLEALLHHIARRADESAQQMVQWTVASERARRDGSQLPPFPEPRVYANDESSAGPSGS
ncbi:hypothetical protein R6Q57_022790 [Mikania cordata]